MAEVSVDDANGALSEWGDESDDEEPISASSVTEAVVTDTDWTTETILSQLKRGNIQLNPRFQRRDAWNNTRKSRFIESVTLGFPIPQLVLAESRTRRGTFIVLDGKQRLLTLRQFAEGSTMSASAPGEFRHLTLSGLDIRKDLHGYDLARLEEDPNRIDDLNSFLNQTIRTVVVRRWPNENFLNTVFLRLNTGSVALSPQELRQALHPGDFSNFLDDFTAQNTQIQRALRNKGPDFRMRDVELLLRYFAFHLQLPLYRGNLKAFLDETVALINSMWTSMQDAVNDIAERFAASVDALFAIFGDYAFYRWDAENSRFERRFNRALYDAMMYHFAAAETRDQALAQADDVVSALKELCTSDVEFLRSIQTTTKSVGATFYRINTWGQTLARVLDTEIAEVVPNQADS